MTATMIKEDVMSLKHWPEQDQPREKLLQQGAHTLSDAELLAIFLRTGVSGKSAIDLARDLLEGFDGLRALLETDQETFCRYHGLGPAKYVQLQATLEIGKRHLMARLQQGDALTSPELAQQYLITQLRHHPHEVFACLFMNNQHQVLAFEPLFRGTIDAASVYPREVVKRALEHNAAAVIFAHNHPSGVAEPSRSDEYITEKLKQALALIEVRVLDHFIIGNGETVSLAERGLM